MHNINLAGRANQLLVEQCVQVRASRAHRYYDDPERTGPNVHV